jgi:endonuclease/exonuclease/phosphatase family metal-dependent hydrolase
MGLGAVAALAAALIGYFQCTEFDPPESLPLSPLGQGKTGAPRELTLLTWNIGYAGLDSQTDFFMDGGRMPGPRSRQAVEQNLEAIRVELTLHRPDVLFLQEVDRASARTFDIDQVTALHGAFPDHQGWYGVNFQSPFVPSPPSSPIGRVDAGVLTLLGFAARASTREQLPGSQAWPVRVFHLKRCAVFSRLPSPTEGKDWVLVNLHLSAFDDGSLRQQQSDFLRRRMLELYEKGHYVVLGGDWNMVLPGVAREAFGPWTTTEENLSWLKSLPEGWTPEGWTWARDVSVPSVRTNDQPYREGQNHRTVIDGFLLSPNVELREVRGLDLGFAHSDHQPVTARVAVRD